MIESQLTYFQVKENNEHMHVTIKHYVITIVTS